jgi:hypothetical protein
MILALLAMLSLGWQSLVVQTHVHHDDPGISWTELGDADSHLTSPTRAPKPAPLDCPLCRQAAQAGACLLPGGVAALAVPDAAVVVLAVVAIVWPGRHRPTGWRSRGPPFPS